MSAEPLPQRAPGPADVRLRDFSGPLDLLLHLARTGEIDLSGLPVLEVVRQCDDYVRLIQDLDLESAGDHLVLAATLVHLKSKSLLPPDPDAAGAVAEEDETIPERLALVVRELRRAAEQLEEREAAMELVYTRPAGRVAEFAGESGIEADLYSLVHAFQSILERLGDAAQREGRITRESMSLVERVTWLMERLQREGRVAFRSLFEDATERLLCILTFLALLEVLRLGVARAFQSHHQSDILIVSTGGPAAAPAEESEPHA